MNNRARRGPSDSAGHPPKVQPFGEDGPLRLRLFISGRVVQLVVLIPI